MPRPGLMRSDTLKKAVANARNFRRGHRSGHFYVVTNALPSGLVGIREDDVSGYFDLTKTARVREFASEIGELIA